MKRAQDLPNVSDHYIEWKNIHGDLIRRNKPAAFSDNRIFWYLNDSLHRDDGPAMIRLNGTRRTWHENGKLIREVYSEPL